MAKILWMILLSTMLTLPAYAQTYTAGRVGAHRIIAGNDTSKVFVADTGYTVTPWIQERFNYASQTALLQSTLYDASVGNIALDFSQRWNNNPASMRYDIPANPNSCNVYYAGRNMKLPTDVREMWVEVWVKFDSTGGLSLPVGSPCDTTPSIYDVAEYRYGYTFIAGRVREITGAFGAKIGGRGWFGNTNRMEFSYPCITWPTDSTWTKALDEIYRMYCGSSITTLTSWYEMRAPPYPTTIPGPAQFTIYDGSPGWMGATDASVFTTPINQYGVDSIRLNYTERAQTYVWTGNVQINTATIFALYPFSGGTRMWFNGSKVIDKWGVVADTVVTYEYTTPRLKGTYPIRIEYHFTPANTCCGSFKTTMTQIDTIPRPMDEGYIFPARPYKTHGWEFEHPTDNKWHQYRFHWKVTQPDSVGQPIVNGMTLEFWLDGQLRAQTLNRDGGAMNLFSLALGQFGMGGPQAPFRIWYGNVRVWNTNPGW